MSRNVIVVEYDPEWPKLFAEEAERIREALGENCVAVEHVGSTAVPGLAAKPRLDIVPVVKDGFKSIQPLEKLGHVYRGAFNIPYHWGYSKREAGIEINLHVFEEGSVEITLNTLFRDYLRAHPEVRDAYGALKKRLVDIPGAAEKNGGRFIGYTLGKDQFIKDVLKKAGFHGRYIRFCEHFDEWKAAEKLFGRDLTPYKNSHHAHFVFYDTVEIVGYALYSISEEGAKLEFAALPKQLERHFVPLCQKWLNSSSGGM